MDETLVQKLRRGCVIPAHPLALTPELQIDKQCQQALTRYYLSAGAGGLAVAVHTTQFAIHNPQVGLYRPVLELAMETAQNYVKKHDLRPPIMIAGLVGPYKRLLGEAKIARDLGYDLGLLSLTGMRELPENEIVKKAQEISKIIPLMGFYLQSSISQMTLSVKFWRELVKNPKVYAIKIAPFNRYQTLDVLRAVAESGREDEIALYTGNDDTIITDLITPYRFNSNSREKSLHIVGGLLGQWACWTRRAVELLKRIHNLVSNLQPFPPDLLTLAAQFTLANQAIFDPEHAFAGCIPGILYVLKKQGLIKEVITLDPAERLAPGQTERIDRIIRDYPHLTDDDFVRENISAWMS